MPIKYLLLLFSCLFLNFAAPQAAPTLLFSAGANTTQSITIPLPILPKKAQKSTKSKPKKRRKSNVYSALPFIYGILGIFFAIWVLWGGIYIMRWLISNMSNLATTRSSDLWTGLAIILSPLLLLVPFAIISGRNFAGKKFKSWIAVFYFLAVVAVVFAMLFFIFGLLTQIWLFLPIALGLAIFGGLGLFLSNQALESYSGDNVMLPATPDENIEWNEYNEE
jgi:hypothetical protein